MSSEKCIAGTFCAINFASRIPGARHVTLPNTGHVCCIEDAAGFDSAMIAFLKHCKLVPAGALQHG